ncbi:MAG: hypothetical protein V4557_14800 [Bacteroidota bacterium]
MALNSKKYPYLLAKDIETLINRVDSLLIENSDIIERDHRYADDSSRIVALVDKDKEVDYFLNISNPNWSGQNIADFTLTLNPGSEKFLKAVSRNVNLAQALGEIDSWIDLIKRHNNFFIISRIDFKKYMKLNLLQNLS